MLKTKTLIISKSVKTQEQQLRRT